MKFSLDFRHNSDYEYMVTLQKNHFKLKKNVIILCGFTICKRGEKSFNCAFRQNIINERKENNDNSELLM